MSLSDIVLFETFLNVAYVRYMCIHLLKASPNVIFRTAAQKLTRFQVSADIVRRAFPLPACRCQALLAKLLV